MTNISKQLGKVILAHRKKNNFSQESLAHKAGVHRTYMGMIERGEKNITLSNLEKISKALDVKLSEIFQEIEKNGY